ncbi:hypothetical protein GECvBN5_gp014 [Salmonella phage GEC_vB_N5]|uniref:Uncharacterized protein n=2 Tax=Markadamsvirinae TaxID=2732013 RepID=A0A7S9SRJ3_9CAUD|nr:hypothetical protein GECvBN3_gp014 [Salmonella phage GEC_vB_N3]QPI15030.1 hypothetical protein GECvBN5_gp014 [Salmonella phage GEC_vB_N5]
MRWGNIKVKPQRVGLVASPWFALYCTAARLA